MKTRNGFVSNSSSSSFVIATKKKDICSHCGRSDPDFVDLIRELHPKNEEFYDDTQVECRDTEEVIESLEKGIEEWENHKKNSTVRYGPDLDKKHNVFGDYYISAQEEMDRADREIEKINKEMERVRDYAKNGYKVAKVQISNHDESVRDMFYEGQDNGSIIVITWEEG